MSHKPPALRRILLAGASGLVGSQILSELLTQPKTQVIAPLRRALDQSHAQLLPMIGDWVDPSAQPALGEAMAAHAPLDAYVCALGTTIKAAGSRAAFKAVDLDLVVRLARLARQSGARHAIVVSSVGADPLSGNFYLSIKGQAEQALGQLGFERVDLLRPGLLLGTRAQHRSGEAWAQRLAPLFNPLLVGGLRRYRAIAANQVAHKAVQLLDQSEGGVFVHEYASLSAI